MFLTGGEYRVPYAGSDKPTSQTLYNTTFQMTEEFVAVYRFHPLLPDELQVGSETYTLNELAFRDPRELVGTDTTKTFLRAFALAPARTLALTNYPRELYNL